MRGSVRGPGALQYNQLRSPGRFWFPHPPPTGAHIMYSLGGRWGVLYIRQRSRTHLRLGLFASLHLYPAPQHVDPGPLWWMRSQAILVPLRGVSMQDPASELLRILILGTWVHSPSSDALDSGRWHHAWR
jgi:hypothetical protein